MESTIKKGVNGRRKWKILGVVLAAALLVSIIPIMSFAGDPEEEDISKRVTIKGVDIEVNAYNDKWVREWQLYMRDGEIQEPFKSDSSKMLQGGSSIRIKPYWEINDMEGVEAGDYFAIDLPKDIFKYANTNLEEPVYLKDSKTSIGTVKISKDNNNTQFLVALNEEGAKSNHLKDGWLRAEATLSNDDGTTTSFTIGDYTTELEVNPRPPSNNQLWQKDGSKAITKGSWTETVNSKKGAAWRIEVNPDVYTKILENKDYETRKNVIIEDYLNENFKFVDNAKISFAFWYDYIRNDGKASSTSFKTQSVEFTKVEFTDEDMANMTADEFKDKIKNGKPFTYGIWQNKYLVVNVGDLPSATKNLPLTYGQVKTALDANYETRGPKGSNLVDEDAYRNTLDAWARIYGGSIESQPGNDATAPLMSFYIEFKTGYLGHEGKVENRVDMSWGDKVEASGVSSLSFTAIAGGADRGTPQSITINKKDGDTEEILSGVKFSLEKLDPNTGQYVAFTPKSGDRIKETSEGAVVFENLPWGSYRIIEEEGLEGYTDQVVYKNESGNVIDGFVIDGSESETIYIDAFNYKEKEETPVITDEAIQPTPGAVAGEEATPTAIAGQSGDVLGEEGLPAGNDEGSVLGDEAKTSDAMNMVPLLVFISIVAMLILLIAIKTKRKPE